MNIEEIKIKRTPNADTRSANHIVSEEELLEQSKQHIEDVGNCIEWMIEQLSEIAVNHDYTKIFNIKEFHDDFDLIQKGHIADFKKMHWFKDIHLEERHHLNDRCPDDVNLFDVLERIADIVSAGMARTGKLYSDTLDAEILTKAYHNTVELLKSKVKVVV